MSPNEVPEQRNQLTGSPQGGEPVFLVIGRLGRPHGVKGEITLQILTDFPERIQPGVTLYVGGDRKPMQVLSSRAHRNVLLIGFDGLEDPESAGEYRNELVFVRADDRPPLDEGEYYHHELIGLQVIDEDGTRLGELSYIMDTGANDVYVVRAENGAEILLPAIEDVILDIDLQAGLIRVHVLPGLLPD